MFRKRIQTTIATFVTILACILLATWAVGQERWKFNKKDFERPPERRVPGVGPAVKPCNGVFEFKWAFGRHWKEGQKIRIIGPMMYGGDLLITTLPSTPAHETKLGPYIALNVSTSTPPDVFMVTTIVKGSNHSADTYHPQTLFVKFGQDNCPRSVRFASDYDPGDDGDDHGGHAGAGNW
jgi:hypothetical protein